MLVRVAGLTAILGFLVNSQSTDYAPTTAYTNSPPVTPRAAAESAGSRTTERQQTTSENVATRRPDETTPRDYHDNSVADSIHNLYQMIVRLQDSQQQSFDEFYDRQSNMENQFVNMQQSVEALRQEQIQKTQYIEDELSYLTGRHGDGSQAFNVTSSAEKILAGIQKMHSEQLQKLDGYTSKQCKTFTGQLAMCGVLREPIVENTGDKTQLPGTGNPSESNYNKPNTLVSPTKKPKPTSTDQCSGMISYSKAQQLFKFQRSKDPLILASASHELTRTKLSKDRPAIGYTQYMPIPTKMKWTFKMNFFKLGGPAEIGICMDPVPQGKWLGDSRKTISIYSDGTGNKGEIWAKGRQISKKPMYSFKEGDEIELKYIPCPVGELEISKNGKNLGKTKFKIRGTTQFMFCVSLSNPGDKVYRSLWGLKDPRF